jgi:hypothetical protein
MNEPDDGQQKNPLNENMKVWEKEGSGGNISSMPSDENKGKGEQNLPDAAR